MPHTANRSLVMLSAENNLLNDTIPETIGQLSSLQVLALFSNQFSGPLPSQISNMASLGE